MKCAVTPLLRYQRSRCGLVNHLLMGGCLFCALEGFAQGVAFQNLDFELGPVYIDPNFPPPVYPDVLPYWTVRFNDEVQPGAYCNNLILDDAAVALMSLGGWDPEFVIAGDRSVYLQAASTDPLNPSETAVNVSISQIGTVPMGTQWLVFDARNQWYDSFPIPPGPFAMTLGGVDVSLAPTQSDGGNVTYAADVSGWTGQTTELSIEVLASPAWGGAGWEGWAVVDSIRFEVPEPTSIALLGLGFWGICWRLLDLRYDRIQARKSNGRHNIAGQ